MSFNGYMTVGSLIEALKEYDESLIVVLSVDDEGNGYRGLSEGWLTPAEIEPDTRLWFFEDVYFEDDDSEEFESNALVLG